MTRATSSKPRVAVFISLSGTGGVERMVMNLVREFAHYDIDLDLVTLRTDSEHFKSIPTQVRHVPLRAKHSLTAVGELARYMKSSNPKAMLVAKDRAGRAALKARRKAGSDCRIAIRLGTNLSTALKNKSSIARAMRLAPIRRLYPLADRLIAVSQGVADDIRLTSGVPIEKITVVRNPVITDELYKQAEQPEPHAWLANKQLPIIMGAGRLTEQKDFVTLINAFAQVQHRTPCRLLILGEGKQRPELEALIAQHSLQEFVLMPGFQSNLYAWLSRADCFVLSSRWEGSPNVLSEALALGIPCVATRCPSGPDEVLQDGKISPLVEMGDTTAMSEAILRVLENPPKVDLLRSAVEEYNAATSAAHYMNILLPEND